jgi:hypothetical protein
MAGCATIPLPNRSDRIGESGSFDGCADLLASLDKQTREANVLDPGVFRVKKYPYLRVDRFIASFREEVDNQAAFAAWMERMQTLDRDARNYEISNLHYSSVNSIDSANDRAGLYSKVATCGDLLRAADFQNVNHQEKLTESVSVSDDYITLRRVLGIYPLTRLFVSYGVSRWHDEARKSFSAEPPTNWKTIHYVPAEKIDMSSSGRIVEQTERDALGIPIYSPEHRQALFRMYAPVWEIQHQVDYDRIGAPFYTDSGNLSVNTDQPVTYTLVSFTRFANEIFTQLNYIIWFPSRPKEGAFDILGGDT